jgi:hypothetical protein
MWQQIIAVILVILAAIYVARTLGPRSWRRQGRGSAGKAPGAGPCGCGKDGDGCH